MVNISLIPCLPASGALINALIGSRWFRRRASAAVACATMAATLALSTWSLVAITSLPVDARVHDVVLGDWIPSIPLQTATGIEMFTVNWTFRLDPLSAVVATLVTGVGLLVHLYAAAEMREESDPRYARFFSWLSLSCAFMLTLVLAGNFFVLLVGWQGMAVCSYLLIGFWFDRQAAASGATKAFIVHWLGDWGLFVAIFLAYFTFGTLDFRELAASVTSLPVEAGTFGAISGICLGLWIAAVAKSAQIPLHVWLPPAADGPAPALALIQTTTLTAGVFVIARNAALFERAPVVMTIVATLGVLTAIMAAGLALVETDIKRVVVYSTISQLGLIFTAVGVGAFSAAIFHLVSIGLSQSLLFIGSSTLIRTMDGERDMHRMGGLRQYMPATFVTMMAGALAVTGIPPLSGFFSATQISSGILAGHRLLWAITCATAILTAVYMSRLMLLTFYGTYRGSARTWPDPNSREAPLPVVVTLMTLAVAIIVLGFIGISIPGHAASIVQLLTSAATANDPKRSLSTVWILAVLLVAVLLPFAGIAIARRLYQRDPGMDLDLASRWPDGQALLANQYYFDELYAATLMSGVFTTARGIARFDDRVITAVVTGCVWIVQIAGWIVHMIERYVVDRIADLFVLGFGFLVFRFRFVVPVRGFGSRFLVASQPRTTNDKPKPRT